MLFDLYDSDNFPGYRLSAVDDDLVRDPLYMAPIIAECASSPDSITFTDFAENLVKDKNAPWVYSAPFEILRPSICDIFEEHRYTRAVNDPKYCFLNSVGVSEVDDGQLPEKFEVAQNYPNPFNNATRIMFATATRADCEIEIINILGQVLYTHKIPELSPGYHSFHIDDKISRNWASGVYFYCINSGEQQITRKMLLLK